MTTNYPPTMLNLISTANGKLDDPLIQEWAIRFYRSLPQNKKSERIQIETDWFNEIFIAQIMGRGETTLLKRLFRELPPQQFSNLKHLILKNWTAWPESVISSAADLLAVIAPDQLVQLFIDDLAKLKHGANIDPLRFASLDHLPIADANKSIAEITHQLVDSIPAWEDDFTKVPVISSLLKRCKPLSFYNVESLLDVALKIVTTDDRRYRIFEHLFVGLFGHNDYLAMVFDREQYASPLKLAGLRPFFSDSAPLEQFDVWLKNSPKLTEILSLLETLSEESLGCQTVFRLLKDSKYITQKLSTKLQTQLAFAACIHSYTKSTLDTSALGLTDTLNLLAIDLQYVRWHSQLTDHLKTFAPALACSALTSRLTENFDDFAAVHIAESMGKLAYPAFIDPLITAIGEDKGDFLCEAAREALSEIGSPAQAALLDQWDSLDQSQKIFGLTVIQSQHNQTTTDFATSRFSQLLADDLESACELILAAPSEQLLGLLKSELRRKQALLDRTFYIAARLLDCEGSEVESAKERAFAEHQRTEQLFSTLESNGLAENDHLYLELECPLCAAVNRYQAKGVVLNNDDHSALLADEFPCASCNEEVEFKFTTMAQMAVFAELVKLTALKNLDSSAEQTIKTMDCRLDGHVMPFANAIAIVRSRLSSKPQDAREWFHLGNLLSNINRPKASINAYQNAVKFAPFAADAQFALAHTLTENQQETDAFKVLQTTLNQSDRWTFLAEFPNFGHSFADLYNHLRRHLGKDSIPVLHPSRFSSSKKLGRNDPCECGSGKKYKKCCGR